MEVAMGLSEEGNKTSGTDQSGDGKLDARLNNEERDHWIWEGPIRVGEY